jgi:uncharacterized membrane-anchored protein
MAGVILLFVVVGLLMAPVAAFMLLSGVLSILAGAKVVLGALALLFVLTMAGLCAYVIIRDIVRWIRGHCTTAE